jgi:hypothetical protein
MDCDYEYCIYNRERKCLVEKVSINDIGMCDSCMIVTLDKEFLVTEKERQLEEIESRWEESDH